MGKLTEEELDSIAKELIPGLERVADMADIHGDVPPDIDDPDFKPPAILPGDEETVEGRRVGFTDTDTGVFSSEDEQLQLAINGHHLMDISILEQLRDGSYRIVLSPNKRLIVQSMMMSGLDSSTEIELTLAPRI